MLAQHLAGDAQLPRQRRGQGAGKRGPQRRDGGVEQHRAVIVKALAAQRLAGQWVTVPVPPAARHRLAVLAHWPVPARPAPGRLLAGLPGSAVHRPERRRGQRHEHRRMGADIGGDAVAAAQPGDEHLPGVALIQPGAQRAHCRPPVPARHLDEPAGLLLAAHRAEHLPGHRVAHRPPAAQPDRPGAPGGRLGDRGQLRRAERHRVMLGVSHRCSLGDRGSTPAGPEAAMPPGHRCRCWREMRGSAMRTG